MALQLVNLNDGIRVLMAEEIAYDQARDGVYTSKRFTPVGSAQYISILRDVVAKGGDADLASRLRSYGCFAETETRRSSAGKVSTVKVPVTAPETFAEGEFNRYYLRALCLAALRDGINQLVVYRARHSENPRPESDALIGKTLDANTLLDDLRRNVGVDTSLGLPPGPNSGLSAKLPTKT